MTDNKIERAKRDLIRALETMVRNEKWKFYKPYESRTRPGVFPQEDFHCSTARIRAIIAANRSGKTEAGAMEVIWRSTGEHPYNDKWNTLTNPKCVPNHGWISIPDWQNHGLTVTLPKMNHYLPDRYKWHEQDRFWLDPSTGSTITIKTAKSGRVEHQGADIDWCWEDEEIPNDIHREIRLRLVDRQGDIWITATPLMGLTWLMDDVYEPWKNGEIGTDKVECFKISMMENPHLPKEEVEWMEEEYEEDVLGAARLHGEFVQLTGLIYPMFDARDKHRLPDAWRLPLGWKVFCAIDFGYTNPFVCLWFAIDGDGCLYLFNEYYKEQSLISDHVSEIKRINEMFECSPSYYVADPEEAQSRSEMAQLGIGTTQADKKFMDGMNRFREYLKMRGNDKPMFYVHPRCKKFIWEMGRYVFKEQKAYTDLNTFEVAEKKHDHGCFVAGTMIKTPIGDVPIEKLRVGDEVFTRKGIREVTDWGMNDPNAEIMRLTTNDGHFIEATPDHPIFSDNRKDFFPLDELRYDDILCIWKNQSQSPMMVSRTEDTLSLETVPTSYTSGPVAEGSISTGQSGNPLMAQSPKSITFTTKTAIHSTTLSRILGVYRNLSIYLKRQKIMSILVAKRILSTLPKSDRWRYTGMGREMVLNGTLNTRRGYMRGLERSRKRVKSVERGLRQKRRTRNTVPINASQQPEGVVELMMRCGAVKSAKRNISLIDMHGHAPVLEGVGVRSRVKLNRRAPVYNMTVDGEHEYFANGVLVSNCDAARYAIMSRPSPRNYNKARVRAGTFADWASKMSKGRKTLVDPSKF